MKATLLKRAGRITAIALPNPNLQVSCAIEAGRASRVTQVEAANTDFEEEESVRRLLERLGANLSGRKPAKRASKKAAR